MVSYFVPRGRFFLKSGNFRQSYQKHQQPHQQAQEKWPMLRQFRQSFSTKSLKNSKQKSVAKSEIPMRNTSNKPSVYNGGSQLELEQSRRNILRKWTGFLFRWAPVGLCVFGAVEWQLHKQKCKNQEIPRTASNFQSKVYCSLPLRILSRCWGWLAACYLPESLRPYVYGWYTNTFNVNLEEALYTDYKHYNNLSEFFTRPLRDGVRVIDKTAPLISPADGKILHFGEATNSVIEQVKGVNYRIESFLGPASWKTETSSDDYAKYIKNKNDGSTALYQCVIYLAPGDYHRFHSPTDWKPTLRRHFSGELLSVSPKVATWLPGLFCLNERALYLGEWKHGFFSYTAVGATNVGSVQIYMDEKLKTNRWVGLNVGAHKKFNEFDEIPLPTNSKLDKGDLVGQFNMGSTIVLIFEAPKNFKFDIKAGQKIRMGEPLGNFIKK
ncbi:phosphatidylserine decarboxylase proenzyme, mitochondrial [Teleopsis dalmanni]|uniref:phosphatidylserine decarboxylase proenzyme, mitochondrial n=1 Tax=Teleopsis dalmanni TaxID=139649 RepID=UPI0018CFAD9C|nr:phosphatidylserine decarboxylase proenzyme, mitochondrial [Teleopsis dalmanni]